LVVFWEIFTVCAAGAEEAAMTSSGTAQGITGQRVGAAVGEQEVDIWAWRLEDKNLASIAQRNTAEKLPMAVGSSALDANVGSEAEPDPSLLRDAPSGLVLLPGDGDTVGSEVKPETG
jgi:hypothetical protein